MIESKWKTWKLKYSERLRCVKISKSFCIPIFSFSFAKLLSRTQQLCYTLCVGWCETLQASSIISLLSCSGTIGSGPNENRFAFMEYLLHSSGNPCLHSVSVDLFCINAYQYITWSLVLLVAIHFFFQFFFSSSSPREPIACIPTGLIPQSSIV